MRPRVPTALVAVLFLTSCGGGGGGGPSAPGQPPAPPRTSGPPDAGDNRYAIHPGLTASDAKRSPVYRTGGLLRVGVDQGPGPARLPRAAVPGLPDVEVRRGRLGDGAGARDLRDYLAHAGVSRRLPGYAVRVIGPSTAAERARVLAAVQLVNAALPEDAKLSVRSPLPGFSLRDAVDADGRYFGSGRELPGTIHVEFSPEAEFHGRDRGAAATSWGEYVLLSRGGFPAYADERSAVILLAHELVHSLGVDGHVPERLDSIMEAAAGSTTSPRGRGSPAPCCTRSTARRCGRSTARCGTPTTRAGSAPGRAPPSTSSSAAGTGRSASPCGTATPSRGPTAPPRPATSPRTGGSRAA